MLCLATTFLVFHVSFFPANLCAVAQTTTAESNSTYRVNQGLLDADPALGNDYNGQLDDSKAGPLAPNPLPAIGQPSTGSSATPSWLKPPPTDLGITYPRQVNNRKSAFQPRFATPAPWAVATRQPVVAKQNTLNKQGVTTSSPKASTKPAGSK